jgi:membrane associated rhomboid family serine protease
MGIYDRDYYRESSYGRFGIRMRSVVFALIGANVALWLLQVILYGLENKSVIRWLACHPEDVYGRGWVWQLLTANFLHAETAPFHILGNMLLLFICGRELETVYGPWRFLAFYLTSGTLAIAAEAGWTLALPRNEPEPAFVILGASGAVMGVVVLFTLLYPRRVVLLFGIVPTPIWLLCLIYVLSDVSGMLNPSSNVAHFAHLVGGGAGVLFRFVDLRWSAISRRFGRWRRRRPPSTLQAVGARGAAEDGRAKVLAFPLGGEAASSPQRPSKSRDPVSARIDELLDKIHRHGKASLSEEELDYLKENSQHYKSE